MSKIKKVLISSLVLFFGIIFISTPNTPKSNTESKNINSQPAPTAEVKGEETEPTLTVAPVMISTPTPSPSPNPTPTIAPTPTAKPIVTPSPLPTASVTPKQSTTNNNYGSYICNCSKTCAQISSCTEAQYQLNVCGCSRRDADHDGIACDSQCQ